MPPTVIFALPQTPDKTEGEYVLRSGKIFESGDYPDKEFSMTADELAAAAAAFEPCDVDLEHVDTVLSGKLGRLESVSLAGDGNSLLGTVRLPKWLDDTFGDAERKVSATWDRATKTLAGLALVRNPRVSDAALMAAFSAARHDTPEGQQIMQELHNTSARGGAVCKSSNTAKMASSHESSTIQKVHDMTTEHGATCSSKKPGQTSWPYMFSRKEGSAMPSAWDWLKAKLEGEPAPEGSATTTNTATMSADDPQLVKLREESDKNAAEVRRLRLERIQDQAVMFADTQIREKRALPAEKEAIVADYIQRATDDGVLGVVTFGEGEAQKKTTRVELLAAMFAAKQQHMLDTEGLKPEELAVLMNRQTTEAHGTDKPADADRVKNLVNMTALGRAQNGKN